MDGYTERSIQRSPESRPTVTQKFYQSDTRVTIGGVESSSSLECFNNGNFISSSFGCCLMAEAWKLRPEKIYTTNYRKSLSH